MSGRGMDPGVRGQVSKAFYSSAMTPFRRGWIGPQPPPSSPGMGWFLLLVSVPTVLSGLGWVAAVRGW